MSVINKMLRDLDSRQRVGPGATSARAPDSDGGVGIRPVDASNRMRQAGRSRRVAIRTAVLALTVGAIAVTWWSLTNGVAVSVKPELADTRPSIVRVSPTAAPEGATSITLPSPPSRVSSALVESALVTRDSLKMDSTLSRAPVTRVPSDKAQVHVAPLSSPELVASAVVRPPRTVVSEPSSVAVAPSLPSRQSATREVLAQAQHLWAAGSRQAASELLRDALAVVERTGEINSKSADASAVAASLVRELAQMELAQGHVSQTLEMLTRLEPALSGVAELWAIRGNAAQRLGRHADSVTAYLTALKLRPNEPRWMLGAAVSLAAQGRIAAATEQAEKARAGGALSPELATYLRQLGVTLPER